MSNGTAGAVMQGTVKVPGFTAYGKFSGFTRTKDGDILLKDKTRKNKDGTLFESQRVYIGFDLLGEHTGQDAVLSVRWAGIRVISDQQGNQFVQFPDPSDARLNIIKVMLASGFDFAGDLAKLKFQLPLTPQNILGEIERALIEKAAGGHVLSLTIMEGDGESNWVNWDGGFVAMPPGTIVPGPSQPVLQGDVTARQKHLSGYIRMILEAAGDNTVALENTITQMAVDWGVNTTTGKTPVLDRLSTIQLEEVIGILRALVPGAPEFVPFLPESPDDPEDWDIPF